MPKVLVLYYSRSGNTEKMAKAVAEGAKTVSNVQVELNYFIEAEDLSGYDAILVGTPTYNHEMPIDIKNLFEEATARNVNLKGKKGATFGSYGWSGEAPKTVSEIMKNKFEMNMTEAPLLANYTPNQDMLDQCRALGKGLAESLIH